MSSPTSTRSFISPLLNALGIMPRIDPTESVTSLHEFANIQQENATSVGSFRHNLTLVYAFGGLKRRETYYISELRLLKEPSRKLKTCHEYIIAVVKNIDGKEEEKYFAFERSPGDAPQDQNDPSELHPDRTLERQMFPEGQVILDPDIEHEQEVPQQQSPVEKATASTTSLSDSIRKKALLANDQLLLLNRPYCNKDDKVVAILRLQPPPDAVPTTQTSTRNSSPSTTPRIRSKKLSDVHSEQDTALQPTVSGHNPTVDTLPDTYADSESIYTNECSLSPSTKPSERRWIYLYELVVIACRLSKSKSLYRLFSKNCYWFAGMLIHVVRVWTDTIMELRDGNRVGHLRPDEDILTWYNNQMGSNKMGRWMNVITVVKAPMNSTLQILVEEYWRDKLKFETQTINLRLKGNAKFRERDKRKEDKLRKAMDDTEEERKKNEELQREREEERRKNEEEREELQMAREQERRKNEKLQREREEERRKNEELQREREEERRRNEEEREELQRAREQERMRNDELQREREKERRKNEELQKAQEEERRRIEELQSEREKEREELRRAREEERMRNEEELQKVRREQEKDRKAREEAEQRMKKLLEYVKAGSPPPPELLADIAKARDD